MAGSGIPITTSRTWWTGGIPPWTSNTQIYRMYLDELQLRCGSGNRVDPELTAAAHDQLQQCALEDSDLPEKELISPSGSAAMHETPRVNSSFR